MDNYFIYKHFIDLSSAMLTGNNETSSIRKGDKEEDLLPLQEACALLPGSVWWKSTQGIYLGANEITFRVIGSKMQLGRHDNELPWKGLVNDWLQNDQKCMGLNATIMIDENMALPNGNLYECRSLKSPLLDSKGNIVGMVGNSFDRSEIEKFKNLSQPKKTLCFTSDFNHCSEMKSKKYVITSEKFYSDISISYREMQCAFHLFMGRTVKEISNLLKLSPRTVETYINNLKLKLNFRKRSELTEIMLENISYFLS